MIKKRHHKIKFLIFLIIFAAAYYFASQSPLVEQYLANPAALKNIILRFSLLAPLAIIILQAFQTTLSIIPSQLTTIIAGFIFGPFLGLLYSLIGAFLGSMLVFSLARKYGKKLTLKFFEKKDLVHFNLLFKQHKLWALFLARTAPLFPNDLVSFAAGLTKIRLRNFNLVSTAGFMAQMLILTYFGSELSQGKLSPHLIIISVVVSLLFLTALFEKQLKKLLIKDFSRLEKEGKVIESAVEKEFRKI